MNLQRMMFFVALIFILCWRSNSTTVPMGYYPVDSNGNFLSLSGNSSDDYFFMECTNRFACNPSSSSNFECSDGFDRQSLMCSKCMSDYFAVGRSCQKCQPAIKYTSLMIDIILLVLLFGYLWHKVYQPNGNGAMLICLFWMQMSNIFDQTGYLAPSSYSGSYTSAFIPLVSSFEDLLNFRPWAIECVIPSLDYRYLYWILILSPFIVIAVGGMVWFPLDWLAVKFGWRCWVKTKTGTNPSYGPGYADPDPLSPYSSNFPEDTSSTKNNNTEVSILSSPSHPPLVSPSHSPTHKQNNTADDPYSQPEISTNSYGVDLSKHILPRGDVDNSAGETYQVHLPANQPNSKQKIGFICLFMWHILYLPIAIRTFELFYCRNYSKIEISVVIAEPWISCKSSDYYVLSAIAALVCIIIIFILPIYCWVVIYRSRKDSKHRNRDVLNQIPERHVIGFIYAPLKREFWWWHFVVDIRKLVIALLLVDFSFRSVFIPALIALVLILSVVVTLLFRPYRKHRDNWLEIILLILMVWGYLCGILMGASQYTYSFDNVNSINNVDSEKVLYVDSATAGISIFVHGKEITSVVKFFNLTIKALLLLFILYLLMNRLYRRLKAARSDFSIIDQQQWGNLRDRLLEHEPTDVNPHQNSTFATTVSTPTAFGTMSSISDLGFRNTVSNKQNPNDTIGDRSEGRDYRPSKAKQHVPLAPPPHPSSASISNPPLPPPPSSLPSNPSALSPSPPPTTTTTHKKPPPLPSVINSNPFGSTNPFDSRGQSEVEEPRNSLPPLPTPAPTVPVVTQRPTVSPSTNPFSPSEDLPLPVPPSPPLLSSLTQTRSTVSSTDSSTVVVQHNSQV